MLVLYKLAKTCATFGMKAAHQKNGVPNEEERRDACVGISDEPGISLSIIGPYCLKALD